MSTFPLHSTLISIVPTLSITGVFLAVMKKLFYKAKRLLAESFRVEEILGKSHPNRKGCFFRTRFGETGKIVFYEEGAKPK